MKATRQEVGFLWEYQGCILQSYGLRGFTHLRVSILLHRPAHARLLVSNTGIDCVRSLCYVIVLRTAEKPGHILQAHCIIKVTSAVQPGVIKTDFV
jgi:hypothetical protein